jgi:hypothetical protein
MNRIVLAMIASISLSTAACAGWITVDGVQVAYVDTRPLIEGRPHYLHRGRVVYEIDGRYYREHEGRWVVYRERPIDLQEERR